MLPVIIVPKRYSDARGWFSETWNKARLEAAGIDIDFVQDNHSYSTERGTLRGLHFQTVPNAQAKLVRCLRGRIFDVAVDIRTGSPTFGRWVGTELSAANGHQLLVPIGFAHAFLTLESDCEVAYKVNSYYAPDCDGGVAWNDPDIAVDWPIVGRQPVLSDKDVKLPRLAEISADFAYAGHPLDALRQIFA